MSRVYNFASGPACLPEAVLKRAADELVCYGQSGMIRDGNDAPRCRL